MKVVFLQDDFPPHSFGGAGFSTYELAKGVQNAGHEVTVITTCRKEGDAGESVYDGLPVYRIYSDYHERWRAWRSLYNPPVVRQVEAILEELRPDAVHANNVHFHLSYACLKTAKRCGAKVVITFRDAMAITYGKLDTPQYLKMRDAHLTWLDNFAKAHLRYNPFRNVCIRYYLKYVSEKFAVSRALAEALQQNGINGVGVVHTGIDVNAWRASESAVTALKERCGLVGKKVILFGGRMSGGKGQAQALEALRFVRNEFPDAVLLVAGTKLVGGNPGVVYTGWIEGEEKKAVYSVSDMVWVPSVYLDPLPRMVLEAMAAGKSVIGTCFGGAQELIEDERTGYVVNSLHPTEIAEKTINLLQDREKADMFGCAGKDRIGKDFSLERYIQKYIKSYII